MQNKKNIAVNLKGLSTHLQPNEEVILSIPAIWDDEYSEQNRQKERHARTCDVVLTNQRLLGYAHTRFPREQLFLEAIPLVSITNVSLRQKSFEPLFRELLISDGRRKVYIRSSRQKTEQLYPALRSAIETYTSTTLAAFQEAEAEQPENTSRSAPIYGRQEIRTTFEQSSLGITVLFIGGLFLEVFGAISWSATHSAQVGLPLCAAGFVSVITAILLRRQKS